jgi:signal transduction histidine kinase
MNQNDSHPESAEAREVSKFRHDARNQLGLIVGYIDLLDRPTVGSLNPQQQSYVERIRSAANTLDEMIDALLRRDEPRSGG